MLKSVSFWCVCAFIGAMSLADGNPPLQALISVALASPVFWLIGRGIGLAVIKPGQTWRWATRLEGASRGQALLAISVAGLIGMAGGGPMGLFTVLAMLLLVGAAIAVILRAIGWVLTGPN